MPKKVESAPSQARAQIPLRHSGRYHKSPRRFVNDFDRLYALEEPVIVSAAQQQTPLVDSKPKKINRSEKNKIPKPENEPDDTSHALVGDSKPKDEKAKPKPKAKPKKKTNRGKKTKVQLDNKPQLQYPFLWSTERKGRLIDVANNGLTARLNNETPNSYSIVCGDRTFSQGSHYWEISIDCLDPIVEKSLLSPSFDPSTSKTQGWFLVIGVVPEDFKQYDNHLGMYSSWGYLCDGGKVFNGGNQLPYGEKFASGDVIGVHADFNKHTLSFFKNGRSQGVAFDNLEGECRPAVCMLRGEKTQLTIRESGLPPATL